MHMMYIYIYELLKQLKCTGWSRNFCPYGKTYGKPTAMRLFAIFIAPATLLSTWSGVSLS